MKRVAKFFGIGVLVIFLLGLFLFLFVSLNPIPSYTIQENDFSVESTRESVERGRKLAVMLCVNCHLDRDTGKLTGIRMPDVPEEFGEIYSQNITQDHTYGIGGWTDGELLTLLRTGIKKDGQYAPPYMAKLPNMADEDIHAIISFLRSEDPMVQAVPVPDQASDPSFLTKFLCRVAWKPFPMPEERIQMPDRDDSIALGAYLAHNLDCFSCHSADFKSNDYQEPEKSVGYFGGGNKPLNLEGEVVMTPNLTPDRETGIGTWSKEKFVKALKYGLKEGEPALVYPMVPYTQLTDEEAGAIYDYLQTIPPIRNKIERASFNK